MKRYLTRTHITLALQLTTITLYLIAFLWPSLYLLLAIRTFEFILYLLED